MMFRFPGAQPFRHRDFARYWSARFVSALATQAQSVAVGWWVYDLTRDPLDLGLVGLAIFLPAVLLVLVAGHVADRFDRRLILITCYAVAALAALGLFACAWVGVQSVLPIYALLVVFGTCRAFANPAGQAIVPNLVPPEDLAAAVAWHALAWQAAIVIGPAVGGLLYLLGAPVVFAAGTLGFLVTLVLLGRIRHRLIARAPEPLDWTRVLAGLRFIRSQPVVLGAISLDLFAVLLGGATALLPIYARDILHVGPAGLGLLRSMPAVGAVLMALWLAHRPLQRQTGRRLFQSVAVFGLGTIGFGLSTHLWLSLVFLFILGAADMVSVYIRMTLVQLETPDAMRGRVSAVNTVFIGASNELGEFESGALAALIGAVPAVVAGGVGTLAVVVLWARWFPTLLRRDRLVEGREPA